MTSAVLMRSAHKETGDVTIFSQMIKFFLSAKGPTSQAFNNNNVYTRTKTAIT